MGITLRQVAITRTMIPTCCIVFVIAAFLSLYILFTASIPKASVPQTCGHS
ncbi:hypothetical protein [Lacrimispora sp.]|uniref:hypothetical protein n=1 Tax=Lacrimispora sp. TaxID=2719234 RepID=UPI0028A7760F|nr:hypothetical protein [Lacrimispora sp.]